VGTISADSCESAVLAVFGWELRQYGEDRFGPFSTTVARAHRVDPDELPEEPTASCRDRDQGRLFRDRASLVVYAA
jgi:hypothetical protein